MKQKSEKANMISARKIRHLMLLLLGPVVIAVIGAWVYLHGGRYISTDNAYVKADIVEISSEISGRVVSVLVKDNTRVEAGDVLLRIDDQPYRIAVARAEAQLADVRGNIISLQQEYLNKKLEIVNAESELAFRNKELERATRLLERGSVSQSQFDQIEFAQILASNELKEAQQALEVVKARLVDPEQAVDAHPQVRQALAQLESARLDLSHVEVRAPTSGIIVNQSMHKGENIIAGAPVLSLVDDSKVWVEANFKETDLTNVKPGQDVTVTIDTFPGKVWKAHVESITPATGAEFSLLPAQNSSGNWVKVVQRVTVNIALENTAELPALSPGMSAITEVDTQYKRSLPVISSL